MRMRHAVRPSLARRRGFGVVPAASAAHLWSWAGCGPGSECAAFTLLPERASRHRGGVTIIVEFDTREQCETEKQRRKQSAVPDPVFEKQAGLAACVRAEDWHPEQK